jgi:hypothetical protein
MNEEFVRIFYPAQSSFCHFFLRKEKVRIISFAAKENGEQSLEIIIQNLKREI